MIGGLAPVADTLAAVLHLVEEALEDEELSKLCLVHFRAVYDQFTAGQLKGARVRLLVERAGRQRQLGRLLSLVREVNPGAHAEFEPRILLSCLEPLLEKIEQRHLAIDPGSAYASSRPAFQDESWAEGSAPDSLVEYARNLAGAPRQSTNDDFPLLVFVRLLSRQIKGQEGPLSDDLKVWHDEACRLLTSGAEEARRLHGRWETIPAATPAGGRKPWYLLVTVKESQEAPGKYLVQAWLHGSPEEPCLGGTLAARDQLPSSLDDLRIALARTCHAFNYPLKDVFVELFLPRELLHDGADQWTVSGGTAARQRWPIGSEHRVVIRFWERAFDVLSGEALAERCQVLRRQGEACHLFDVSRRPRPGTHAAAWIGANGWAVGDLATALHSLTDVVCCLLGYVPDASPDPADDPWLNVLFDEGIPVALWLRRHPEGGAASASAALKRLVRDKSLESLHDQVWQLRKDALPARHKGLWHMGSHLTLLWDDPERLPPASPRSEAFEPLSMPGLN
jgi:hypothetical protein